ncbi:MAG: hypothetical protein H7Y04_14840 [Verrucomicrobia bacterium]|nr:hypothetical protein [Cytophagales bacterium]
MELSTDYRLNLSQTVHQKTDEKFVKAMKETLEQFKIAKTPPEMQSAANRFELIGKNATTEWLPNYYAALCYVKLSFMEKETEKRDLLVEKAENLLQAISTQNDEIFVMRAMVAQANLAIDGQARWEKQGRIFQENLDKAEKLNPENPRIAYMKGNNLFYTPEAFGGGAKVACPELLKAKAKFGLFKVASEIHPNWGEKSNEELLKNCK